MKHKKPISNTNDLGVKGKKESRRRKGVARKFEFGQEKEEFTDPDFKYWRGEGRGKKSNHKGKATSSNCSLQGLNGT